MNFKIEKYVWRHVSANDMVFWPPKCTSVHFASSGLLTPKKLYDEKIVKKPLASRAGNPFEQTGVSGIGLATKAKDFFQIIGRQKYSTFILVLRGELNVRFLEKKGKLGFTESLIIPSNCVCEISAAKKSARIFWAHLDSRWARLLSHYKIPTIRKFEKMNLLQSLVAAYESECFSENVSRYVLEHISSAMVQLLRDELKDKNQKKKSDSKKLESFFSDLHNKPSLRVTGKYAAEKLNTDISVLDSHCVEKFNMKFSKYVSRLLMQKALTHLHDGKMNLARTAANLGYSSAFAFSRAFKAYYGVSPKNYTK